jgi:hypothetical protein
MTRNMLLYLHVSTAAAQFVPDDAANIRPFGHKQTSWACTFFTAASVGKSGKSWNIIDLPSNMN